MHLALSLINNALIIHTIKHQWFMKKNVLLALIIANFINVFANSINGKCGKNASWTLDNDGTLIVSGSGETYDFSKKPQNAPFIKNGTSEIIKAVNFTQFTGKVNDNLFYGCHNITTIILSEKQQCSFSFYAFSGCDQITNLEIFPNSIQEKNRYRYIIKVSPEILKEYFVPVNTIQYIILNQNSDAWYETIIPFEPIETYGSLRQQRGKNGEYIIGQWQNGGWNGVVQRTTINELGNYKCVNRTIAIEENGLCRDKHGYPIDRIEERTEVNIDSADLWFIEKRVGEYEIQKDYYITYRKGTEKIYCQTLYYTSEKKWRYPHNDKWFNYSIKYRYNFPDGDCFIADNPEFDSLVIERSRNLSLKEKVNVPFRGWLSWKNDGFFYGDFTRIRFEEPKNQLYPFSYFYEDLRIFPVSKLSKLLTLRNGIGIFYNPETGEEKHGVWKNGEYIGSPESVTFQDFFNCPFALPINLVISSYIKESLIKWMQKGEFETTQEWRNRTSDSSRQQKIIELEQKIQVEYLKKISKKIHLDLHLELYDADNQCFPVSEKTFGTMNVFLDKITPQLFKASWDRIVVIPTYFINNNKVDIFKIDFLLFDEQVNGYRKVAYYLNPENNE